MIKNILTMENLNLMSQNATLTFPSYMEVKQNWSFDFFKQKFYIIFNFFK